MHRLGRGKVRRSLEGYPRHPLRRVRKATDLGRRELRALSKTELISRVLELQARAASAVSRPAEQVQNVEAFSTKQPIGTEQGPPAHPANSLVIASSVRSGQIVEFPNGDVTVIGSVGSGAEIIAGGSIHVYGTLRGRAIAGSLGYEKARIFCQNLQAELLSIAGRYRLAENFDPKLQGRAVQAHLDGLLMALILLESDAGPELAIWAGGLTGGVRRRAADGMRQLIGIHSSRDGGLPTHQASKSSAAGRGAF